MVVDFYCQKLRMYLSRYYRWKYLKMSSLSSLTLHSRILMFLYAENDCKIFSPYFYCLSLIGEEVRCKKNLSYPSNHLELIMSDGTRDQHSPSWSLGSWHALLWDVGWHHYTDNNNKQYNNQGSFALLHHKNQHCCCKMLKSGMK